MHWLASVAGEQRCRYSPSSGEPKRGEERRGCGGCWWVTWLGLKWSWGKLWRRVHVEELLRLGRGDVLQ